MDRLDLRPAHSQGHDQRGQRYAAVVQPDWLATVATAEQETLVMCDLLATVDLDLLAEPVGYRTLEEMGRVDDVLALVLDL